MWSVCTLCCLPESIFHNALSSALDEGISQLNSSGTNPYEPLKLVERLLWLSNTKSPLEDSEQIHRALVMGGACGFLTYVLSHTGALDPQDRGLWRAKGLAMTCLGNLIERMGREECHKSITKEMINAVVATKEDEGVPLVQRGQAIFTLQRYTVAADRCGIQPYYREDTSNMVE
ncbi:hypothetical protein FRC01_013382 [Tulasnella sp. 417]|nr:hypothetical protein FRC01_013382 [Tulasnella sp. 417]